MESFLRLTSALFNVGIHQVDRIAVVADIGRLTLVLCHLHRLLVSPLDSALKQ